MSKIVSKLMQSQSSQAIKPNQSRNENTENNEMFAALFGGVRNDVPPEEPLIGKTSIATVISTDSGDESAFDEQTSDDLMALIASLRGGGSLGHKINRPQGEGINDELELEQAATSPDSENLDALALPTGGTLFPETRSGTAAMPRSGVTGLTNMIFEDGAGPNGGMENAAANVVSKKPARMDGNGLLGQNKASSELIGPHQDNQNSTKIAANLTIKMENALTKNMTEDLAKLQAFRAANLEQQNADIDNEAKKADPGELNGKLGKNGLTVAGLKQMMASTSNPLLTGKAASTGEVGRAASDLTRLAKASLSALDTAPAITGAVANGSSNGQSGGQSNHQGGSNAGSQSAGGLLGSLNNFQILDMAKDNWTEMLLQRVKSGLSGGKDQLDFQLNPRNLGKMRISLVIQNDRTNIQIQTETSAAASMLSESEARLAQMLEASGLRLGSLNSGQFQGFGGAGSDQQANQQSQNRTGSLSQSDDIQGEVVEELGSEGSDNLINIQA